MTWGAAGFWLNTDRPPDNERVLWVGPGTRDTGLSLTRLTFQITHATDLHTNAERPYHRRIDESRAIEAAQVYQSGENLHTERVNHYVTDGEIALASLVIAELAIAVHDIASALRGVTPVAPDRYRPAPYGAGPGPYDDFGSCEGEHSVSGTAMAGGSAGCASLRLKREPGGQRRLIAGVQPAGTPVGRGWWRGRRNRRRCRVAGRGHNCGGS